MVARLTVSAWSATVGISKQAGYKAVERCEIPLVGGTVDPEVATMLYRKRTRVRTNAPRDDATVSPHRPRAAARPELEDHSDDYWHSRGRRERAQAELAELKLAEQRGELVRAAAVESAHGRRVSGLREALLQIPARLAAVLAAESDQARCHDVLQAELHQVLEQVAKG